MNGLRTLRGRLSAGYAVALIAGLVLFAAFALALIDHVQRSSVDAQLAAQARAAAALVAPEPGTTTPELEDPGQFRRLVGATANGALLAPSGRVLLASVVDVPDVIRAFAAAHGISTDASRVPVGVQFADLRAGGTQVRAAAVPLLAGGRPIATVVLWRARGDVAAIDRDVAIGFALAIPVLTLLAALGSRAVARRALAPLGELATLAAQIEATDLTKRLHRAGDDELGALCETFDRMLERLERAFERQRRFASDIAHELRAPLAVMLAEIDLARRRSRTAHEYERTLDAVRTETLELDALTSDLLAAYRDDDVPRREPVELVALVRAAAARVAVLADARRITLELATQEPMTIAADSTELTRALVAILENAFKYGGSDRSVHVAVSGENGTPGAREHHAPENDVAHRGDVALITIRDEGPGFTPAALSHAVERFWRDDAARTRGGTGLGLSLAEALVRRSSGTLALANDPRGGALVRLTFPREPSASRSSQRHVGVVP